MKRSDAHIHIFADGYPGRYGKLFPRGGEIVAYENIRRVHGIGRALVIGFEGEPWAKENNRHIARLARKHSWIVPLAYCSAALPSVLLVRQLSVWWRMGFRGISLYCNDVSDCQAILAWPGRVFEKLNEKRAIISLNARMCLLDALSPAFPQLSQTRILVSHLGSPEQVPDRLTSRAVATLFRPLFAQTRFPHVGVKVSGLYGCNEYPHFGISRLLEELKERFGSHRLFWGSDFSPSLDAVTFAQTITPLEIDPFDRATQSAVFEGNLERIIRRVAI